MTSATKASTLKGSSGPSDDETPVEQVLHSSRTFLDRQADSLTTMLAQRVEQVADDLRSVGNGLAESESTAPTATFAEQGADFVDRVAAYLRSANGQTLVSDAERFSAQNPIVATGAALLLGVMVSRFFKISSVARRPGYDG